MSVASGRADAALPSGSWRLAAVPESASPIAPLLNLFSSDPSPRPRNPRAAVRRATTTKTSRPARSMGSRRCCRRPTFPTRLRRVRDAWPATRGKEYFREIVRRLTPSNKRFLSPQIVRRTARQLRRSGREPVPMSLLSQKRRAFAKWRKRYETGARLWLRRRSTISRRRSTAVNWFCIRPDVRSVRTIISPVAR